MTQQQSTQQSFEENTDRIGISDTIEIIKIKADKIHPNDWNPNELSDVMFNRLVDDIQNIGFLQPVLVAPEKDGTYRIVDGEHRYEVAKMLDMEDIPCVVVSGDFAEDETKQKFQTMRMNLIRGRVDKRKLAALVNELAVTMPVEEIAESMAFDDVDALKSLIEDTRQTLPQEMRKEFDKAKDEIKTVDDLSLVLNRLFTKYGSTLPYHYMIMDFGGKEHLWVRMSRPDLDKVKGFAEVAREAGITFSSLVMEALKSTASPEYISANQDKFEAAKREDENSGQDPDEEGA